jgi:hypothetical protein
VAGHREAHHSQADECDFLIHCISLMSFPRRRESN